MQVHDNGSIRPPSRHLPSAVFRMALWLALALMLAGGFYWGGQRVLQLERERVEAHFARLEEGLREHEAFLLRVAQRSDDVILKSGRGALPVELRVVAQVEEVLLYEGREFSFAMPFTLAQRTESVEESDDAELLSLGVMLASDYSSFWSLSRYPSAQLLVLDPKGPVSIAVPSIGSFLDGNALTREQYTLMTERVREALAGFDPVGEPLRVHWMSISTREAADGYELQAFIPVVEPKEGWSDGEDKHSLVAVSLLELDRIIDTPEVPVRRDYDALALVSPDGVVLAPFGDAGANYRDGLNIRRDGLVFKVSATGHLSWAGLYRLNYARVLKDAQGWLFAMLALSLLTLAGGWMGMRWHARYVAAPLRYVNQALEERDAFIHALVQALPVALSVLRCDNRQVLLQNTLADCWLGDVDTVTRISQDWVTGSETQRALEERVLNIDGRPLLAGFMAARYQGVPALLCTFVDLSALRQAERLQAEAQRAAADVAKAQSVFLAAMSHEVRTPLYGVLGALELLGLTPLSAQQCNYVSTIGRSSSNLLQLLSDILDVSKIDAGQMALDLAGFDPLELAEAAVAEHAESARDKGLQLYTCIDPDVPGQVKGDAARIRQVLNYLLSNAVKFTDLGRVVLRLRVLARGPGHATLQWQVTDTGIGISQQQQGRLFEPFYQAHGRDHTVSGTGLGLPISGRLSELMGGSLRVVSEVGLGSSFAFTLRVPVLADRHTLYEAGLLRADTVHVRAPVRELAQSLARWIERWGATPLLVDGPLPDARSKAVLLDLLAVEDGNPAWPGPRVLAVSNAAAGPSTTPQGLQVGLYDLAGILKALQYAQDGAVEMAGSPPTGSLALGLRVLVAEDNPINQMLLKEQLEALGCRVTLTADGREALQRWQPDAFDALVTDVNMPVMNGYELVQALRCVDSQLPIIGVTANALRAEGERCMAVGMNAWLVKPITMSTLQQGLLRVCGRMEAGYIPAEPCPAVAAPDEVAEDVLQVPAKMRDLFIKTMQQDLDGARQALEVGDMAQVRQQVHRLGGALSVVQALALSRACGALEEALVTQPAGPELDAAVQGLMARIDSTLAQL